MGKLVKLIGSGIGLASEAMAARKQPAHPSASTNAGESSNGAAQRDPAPAPAINEPPPQYVEFPDHEADKLIASGQAVLADHKDEKANLQDYSEDDATSEEGDEEQWALDDAVEEQAPHTPSGEESVQDANQLTDAFMRSHPPPAYAQSGRLPCPVILPQRRPRDKKRGFVRAYAPVLEDCGIDQATFLDFLKTFHDASKASPWLTVVNIAGAAAGLVPSVIGMGVSITVQVSAGIAMEVQARTRHGLQTLRIL
jgi:hypothetical protein